MHPADVRFAGGRYTLFLPRVEMGQNILTALKQVACDELGVPWSLVDARLPSTNDIRRVKATVGSESIMEFAIPLAQACATLRDALAAGRNEGLLPAQPRPFTELRAFARSAVHVGRAQPIEQGPAIVRGRPLYVADVRRPGMQFGRVLRAPVRRRALRPGRHRPHRWPRRAAKCPPSSGSPATWQTPARATPWLARSTAGCSTW